VYLPLSSSTPILAGGLVRYVADWHARRTQGANYSETDQDSSPGVLLSTGYIAGGAIAGVLIAFLSFPATEKLLNAMGWVGKTFSDPEANWPAVCAFAFLMLMLLLVGTGFIMKAPPGGRSRMQPSGNGNSGNGNSEYVTDQLA
jgi:hypothetical protein